VVTFFGFVSMIYAIVRKPKSDAAETLPEKEETSVAEQEEPTK